MGLHMAEQFMYVSRDLPQVDFKIIAGLVRNFSFETCWPVYTCNWLVVNVDPVTKDTTSIVASIGISPNMCKVQKHDVMYVNNDIKGHTFPSSQDFNNYYMWFQLYQL